MHTHTIGYLWMYIHVRNRWKASDAIDAWIIRTLVNGEHWSSFGMYAYQLSGTGNCPIHQQTVAHHGKWNRVANNCQCVDIQGINKQIFNQHRLASQWVQTQRLMFGAWQKNICSFKVEWEEQLYNIHTLRDTVAAEKQTRAAVKAPTQSTCMKDCKGNIYQNNVQIMYTSRSAWIQAELIK